MTTSALRAMLSSARLSPLVDDNALLAAMLRFEAALARAQADCGLAPRAAADAIGRVCQRLLEDPAMRAEAFDAATLAAAARRASTLAVPFVDRLTELVAAEDHEAARFVHLGSTSQDVVDTATMLVARAGARELDLMLAELGDALAALADRHRDTAITGRTLLQAALPVSFGWKVAGWLDQVARTRSLLERTVDEQAALQFGGAGGTLSAMGESAPQLTRALADGLSLPAASISWHGARDRIARIGVELAMVCGVSARIGRDISLLMQPEVAEVFEPAEPGRGMTPGMPHKRNPVGSMLALEAAYRAPGLAGALLAELASEHERGLGTWQNSALVLRELLEAAGSAVDAILETVSGLRVDSEAMRENLARTGGFVYTEAVTMALAGAVGRPVAVALVERVARKALQAGQPLRAALGDEPEVCAALPAKALDALFDPSAQLTGATAMVDAVLADWRALRADAAAGQLGEG